MNYRKTKNKFYNFSIIAVLTLGFLVFINPAKVEAGSLGNCDQTVLSPSEYEACVQSETNGTAQEECRTGWDETGKCKDNAATYDGTYEVPSGGGSTGRYTTTPVYTTTTPTPTATVSASGGWNPGLLEQFSLPSGSIYLIVRNVLNWLLIIFSLLAIIGFAVSGVIYIISSGNDDAMKKAKSAMINSIIGVIVGLSGLVIIYAIDRMLRGYGYF